MRVPFGRRKLVAPLVVALTAMLVVGVLHQLNATAGSDDPVMRLEQGNARFASGNSTHPNAGAERRTETAQKGQKPFAAVIACADSRVPVELLFDQGIGDVFVIRVAGNVSGPTEIGSVEYGVEHLGTEVVVVLGHTKCGAVTAAVSDAELPGSLPSIVDLIRPAAASARAAHPDLEGDKLVGEAVRANVWQSMDDLLTTSAIVREAIEAGHVRLIGAVYNIESGKVEWLGPHPDQSRLLAANEPGEQAD